MRPWKSVKTKKSTISVNSASFRKLYMNFCICEIILAMLARLKHNTKWHNNMVNFPNIINGGAKFKANIHPGPPLVGRHGSNQKTA